MGPGVDGWCEIPTFAAAFLGVKNVLFDFAYLLLLGKNLFKVLFCRAKLVFSSSFSEDESHLNFKLLPVFVNLGVANKLYLSKLLFSKFSLFEIVICYFPLEEY